MHTEGISEASGGDGDEAQTTHQRRRVCGGMRAAAVPAHLQRQHVEIGGGRGARAAQVARRTVSREGEERQRGGGVGWGKGRGRVERGRRGRDGKAHRFIGRHEKAPPDGASRKGGGENKK